GVGIGIAQGRQQLRAPAPLGGGGARHGRSLADRGNGYPVPMPSHADAAAPHPGPALLRRRLLSLLFDVPPAAALWLLLSALFTFGHTWLGNHDPRQNIAPFSALQWLLWLGCWLLTGLYATASWKRGGQTLGMRPWRIRVVARNGGTPGRAALWTRYA